MITPGICSITLNVLSPEQVVEIAAGCGLQAIEWWGGKHATPGNLSEAQHVARLGSDAGLAISSYGSYYRAAVSEPDSFAAVLDSAAAMGAPTIRVWAGGKNAEKSTPEETAQVIADLNRIADLAADCKISITLEFHGGTLTNTGANARALSDQLPHPNIFFSWQPPHGFPLEHCVEGLDGLLPRLSTIHVYHWTIGSYERSLFDESQRELTWPTDYFFHPLRDGVDRWRTYLQRATGDHFALLEFAKDASVEQVRADAATLIELCRERNS